MTANKLRFGVIGTANIGRFEVIPAIQCSNNSKVVAVASRDKQKAFDFAAAFGIPRSYGSYEALLDDPGVDALYIPLPNSLHREWAIKGAEAGKHILCEKPLALNAAECAEMADAAERNGVKLMEAFMYRFHPRTEKVIELIQSGAIGDLRLIHAAFTFRVSNPADIRLQPALGGGSLMDVGSYCVNLSRTLTGAEPVEVQAYARWGETGIDEQMVGTLRFANDLFAQFDGAFTAERRECYQAVGSKGYLDVPKAFLPGTADTEIYQREGRRCEVLYTIPGANEYQLMVEHFADCVRNDRPLRYPPLEAAANMRVIEALYHSARNGGRPESI